MEFIAKFIEIIAMLGFLLAIGAGILYLIRHRGRLAKWVNNYDARDNVAEKEYRLRQLKHEKEDIEAAIKRLSEAETGED